MSKGNNMSREILIRLSEQASKLTAQACHKCSIDTNGGCCRYCAHYNGYLPLKQFKVLKQQYEWNKDKGFATSYGCSLPREKRSTICLSYYCSKIIKMKSYKLYTNFKGVLPNSLAARLYQLRVQIESEG